MQISNPEPLRRFFAGVAENAFAVRLGMADPPLVDYISDLLVRFTHRDSLYCIRDARGRRLTEVVEMLSEAAERVGLAKRRVHRHIGDFTLFWTGMYPEALSTQSPLPAMDSLIDYAEFGKRAYWIASTIESETQDETPGEVLERLSAQFELCSYGLKEIRMEWERRDDGEAPRPFLIN